MSKSPQRERIRDLAWRPRLSPAEAEELRAWLAAHPEFQDEIEVERALTRALDRLPPAPVPSNFTALVLQGVNREESASRRRDPDKHWSQWLHRWIPRTALAALLAASSLVSYRQIMTQHRAELAESVATVSDVATLPPDILKDFDAVRALSQSPPADEELLALLQ